MAEESDNQIENTLGGDKLNLKPWLWKKGQSGNPTGRPKGKTMKEYTKDYLASMTEEERQDFLDGLPKETVWKMAEGNPENKSDVTSGGEKIETILVKFIDAKDDTDTNGVQGAV